MKLINWERKGKFKQMEIKHVHCYQEEDTCRKLCSVKWVTSV